MRAIRIERYGGPEVLLRRDIPVPAPGPGEVLVRLRYAGINFMDIHTRQGKYQNSRTYPVPLPCTLGMEGAGEVAACGEGARVFRPGDRVAWCISWGSYAEFAVVPESRLAGVPAEISLDVAAASIFQGSTAHYLIHDVARLKRDDICLIHAASGGIGQMLVQYAKALGARVFVTASTPEKAAVARTLGADYALPYEGAADRVRELTDGRGADVVFDAVGRATLRDSFRAARVRGLVVNYGSVSGSLRDLDPIELGEAGSLFLTRPRLADHMRDHETVRRRAHDIFAGIRDGSLRVAVAREYGFGEVEDAHAALEERRQIGKSVLKIA